MTTTQTISREWLQKTISEIEAMRDEMPFGLDEDENKTLAALKLALSAMDSEPVAWWTGPEPTPTGEIESIHDHETGSHAIPLYPLYAAPPAPVAVPDDAALRILFEKWFAADCAFDESPSATEEDNLAWKEGYWHVWKACRAAMQAEPVTAATVPDGWKMVPVDPTERMVIDGFESEPDETFSAPEVWEAYQAMSGCRQAAHRARLCYAAMLAAAPAAPEQEV